MIPMVQGATAGLEFGLFLQRRKLPTLLEPHVHPRLGHADDEGRGNGRIDGVSAGFQHPRAIAEDGADVLYRGPLARAIAEHIRTMGGYLALDDLAAVRPREVEPLVIGYDERTIHVLP
jgi:hypothetical protein